MPRWPHKEPAFFSPPEVGGITKESQYLELFEDATGHKMVGEASVSYLYAEEAPARIKSYLGEDTKIIILLRNPVDLAYSLWGHQVREGFEDLSFEEGLQKENERLAHPEWAREKFTWIHDYAYTRRPAYVHQIARYDALFPAKNIKIFIFEEFFADSLPQWEDLCDFLEIDAKFRPSHGNVKYNAAGKMRSTLLRRILRESMPWKEPVKKIIPKEMRSVLRNWIERANRIDTPLPSLDKATRSKLENVFDADVRALEKRLGRNLEQIWF